MVLLSCFFFFKQKTAYDMRISDWSSDVCSSDLLLDLPEGFSYRVISRSGDRMSDGLIVPAAPDGMGCFDLGGNRVARVRNHVLKPGAERKGAFAGGTVNGARVYATGASGEPLPGGTTTIVYDMAFGEVKSEHLNLE